jgi:N-acetylglutamate synthase-like GNAT family acetyltransferase
MASMHPGPIQIRRATVDDLPALKAMWAASNWPVDELENRLTEFHVVESGGQFAGALGLQVVRQHALLHSEDYTDFGVADEARKQFWERIQKISANLGVFRLWTREKSPFWRGWGFQSASPETLERLPEEWKNREGQWLTLELKNEDAINKAMKVQFAGLMAEEQQQTARMMEKARVLRAIVIIGGFGIFFICLAVAFYLVTHRQYGFH